MKRTNLCLTSMGQVVCYLHQKMDILQFYSINKKTSMCLTLIHSNPILKNEFTNYLDYFIFVRHFFPSTRNFCAPYDVIKSLMEKESSCFQTLSVSDWEKQRNIDLSDSTVKHLVHFTGPFVVIKKMCPLLQRISLINVSFEQLCEFNDTIMNYPSLRFAKFFFHSTLFTKEPQAVVDVLSLFFQCNPFIKVVIDIGIFETNKLDLMNKIKESISKYEVIYHSYLSQYEKPYCFETNPFYFNFFNNYVYTQKLVYDGVIHMFDDELKSLTESPRFLNLYYPLSLYSNVTNGNYIWITTLTKLTMQKRVFSLFLPTSLKELVISEDFLYWSYNLQNIYFDCKVENASDLNIRRMEVLTLNKNVFLPSTLLELNVECVEEDFTCPIHLTQLRLKQVQRKVQVTFNEELKELFICKVPDYVPKSVKYLYTPTLHRKIEWPLESLELEQMKKADSSRLPLTLKNLTIHSTASFQLYHLTELTRLNVTVVISNSKIQMDKFSIPKNLQECNIYIEGNISKTKRIETLKLFNSFVEVVPIKTIGAEFQSLVDKKIKKFIN